MNRPHGDPVVALVERMERDVLGTLGGLGHESRREDLRRALLDAVTTEQRHKRLAALMARLWCP